MIKVMGDKLRQYDLTRAVQIVPASGETLETVEVWKSSVTAIYSVPFRADDDYFIADIPNILLQGFGVLTVRVKTVNSNGNHKTEKATFYVSKRNKPEDYVYTETPVIETQSVDETAEEVLLALLGGASSAEAETKSIVERTIEKLNNSNLESIGSSGMRHCANMKEVILPNVVTLGQYAFYQCTALERVELASATSINNYAFGNCTVLNTLILSNAAGVCSISNANALTGTAIESGTGFVYVPAALLDAYKADGVWSNFADKIRAIEDNPTVCDPALAEFAIAENLIV